MQVIEVKNQATWDQWLCTIDHTPFPQTWDWGVFQMSQGYKVWRLAVVKDQSPNSPLVLVQVAKVPIRFGFSFLVSPYGPVVLDPAESVEAVDTLLKYLNQLPSAQRSIFWRAEPSQVLLGEWSKVKDREPSHTWILDLSLPADELLAQMHPKTRYNISLAERKGVQVRFGRDVAAVDGFIQCIHQTYGRKGIKSFPEQYLRTQLATIPWEEVTVAELNGKIIASNIIAHFGDTTTYLHGGSLHEYKEVMAPHALQWQSILQAQRLGKRWYDFYGIAPQNVPNHPWKGITRFKLGFGGQSLQRPGTFELPFTPRAYTLLNSLKRLRF